MTRVEINGIGFSGTTEPENGLVYRELRDWDGRPDARGGGDAVPGGQGVYARTGEFRESRVITVLAGIVTDSTSEYFEVKRRVENMPMFGEMRVDQGDGYWARQVEVESIDVPDAHTRTWTPFTIDLVAPDPVRYRDSIVVGPVGLPVRDGGLRLPKAFPWNFGTSIVPTLDLVNEGSQPCFPTVTVWGSASSIILHGGPRRIEFGAFDGRLVVDSLERRAWLNGGEVTRQLTRRDWHLVPPGETQSFFFEAVDPSPDLQMTVEYRIGAW